MRFFPGFTPDFALRGSQTVFRKEFRVPQLVEVDAIDLILGQIVEQRLPPTSLSKGTRRGGQMREGVSGGQRKSKQVKAIREKA